MADPAALSGGSGVQLALLPLPMVPESRRELHQLGVEVLHAWAHVGQNPARPLCPHLDVFAWCIAVSDPSLQEVLALIASHLDSFGFSELNAIKLRRDMGHFVSTLVALDVPTLRAVVRHDVEDFLNGAVRGRGPDSWREPSIAVISGRRTAVRTLYMTARHLGLAEGDPTLDISVPSRRTRSARVLSGEEELLGRIASRMTFCDTRGPCIWALGQATAMPAEIGRVGVADVDLERHRVWLTGTKDRRPRWGLLTDWGVPQLAERIAELDGEPDRLIAYDGRGGGSRADSAITNKLVDIFTFAGIREPGVSPSSLVAWAGRQVFDTTQRIEAVADALGVTSLDRAAKLIGWRWHE